MFLFYQYHLIDNSLLVLFSLLFFNLTLIQQAVNGDDESNLPHAQGYQGDEALDLTIGLRQSQNIMDWSNNHIKDSKMQKIDVNSLNTNPQIDIMNPKEEIFSKGIKHILLANDTVNQEFYKNIQNNSSNENWDDLVTNVEQEKDIICLYRKASNTTVISKADDWKTLLNIAEGFTVYSVKNYGSKYLICLKKENTIETTTAMSNLQTLETSSLREIDSNGNNLRRNSKNTNININKVTHLHNFHENCDDDESNKKIYKTDDTDRLENNKLSTVFLKNFSPDYTKNKVNNMPNYLQEYILKRNMNQNANPINNKFKCYSSTRKYPRQYLETYGRNFKTRRIIKKPKMFILISDPKNIYKIKYSNKIIHLLKTRSQLSIKNLNPLVYKSKYKYFLKKRITAIPYLVYLHRLNPLINIRLLSLSQNKNLWFKILIKYIEQLPLCINEHKVFLLPLGLLTFIEHFSFHILKMINQMNLAKMSCQYYNFLHVKTFTSISNLLFQMLQYDPNYVIISRMKDFNTPFKMNIDTNHPKQNEYENYIPIPNKSNTNCDSFMYRNVINAYKENINNTNKNFEMRIMEQDQKDLNNITETFLKIETTTQYLNLLNESTSTNIVESTSIQNDVTESIE